jgi:hypothetical protein
MTPPKTTPVLLLRLTLMILAIGLGTWGMVAGIPFQDLTPTQQTVVGWFRLIYGLVFGVRLARSFAAAPLFFGWQGTAKTRRAFAVWLVVCVMIVAGFLTPVALVAHLLFQAFVQTKNRSYSVDDVLHRFPGFCLLFLNSHRAVALDSWLGWDFGLTFSSGPGANFFAWCFGLIMFSTGYEKIWSFAWRKGLGFYHFVSIPFIARPSFRRLRNYKALCIALSWGALFLELGYISTLFHPLTAGLVSLAVVGFGLTLSFGAVNFFFIGVITALNASLIAILGLLPQSGVAYTMPWFMWLLIAIYSIGCVSIFNFTPIRDHWVPTLLYHTVHLRPYILFNEVHFYGLYIYRIIAHTPEGRVDCIKAFKENGEPGPMQRFRPVTIYAAYSRVSDYCIAVIHNQEKRIEFYGRLLPDLGQIALEQMGDKARNSMTRLTFEVKVYDPDADYNVTEDPWRCDWTEIGHYDLSNGIRFIQEGTIPPYGKTMRWPVLWN